MQQEILNKMEIIRYKITENKNMSKQNELKIKSFKNKYEGKRCFIIGGSPSIKQLDLSKLNNEYTFTMNRGYMVQDDKFKHSTFHVITAEFLFLRDKIMGEIPRDFCKEFFITAGVDFKYKDKVTYIKVESKEMNPNINLQNDITKPLYASPTTVVICIQIAKYMGFKDIFLIGVDADFSKNKGHAYKENDGEIYRQIKYSINETNLMYEAIKEADDFLKKENKNLYNASPTGIIDCIPRVNYENLF